jgi:hypothetical protein
MTFHFKHAKIKLFADDAKLYVCFSNMQQQHIGKTEIEFIADWAEQMQLKISFHKCSVLHFGPSNPLIDYCLSDSVVEVSRSICDLGVTVSSDMKFSVHCSNIAGAAFRMVNLLFRVFPEKSR